MDCNCNDKDTLLETNLQEGLCISSHEHHGHTPDILNHFPVGKLQEYRILAPDHGKAHRSIVEHRCFRPLVMIYINTCQLGNDLQDWASRLPRFAAICGIPRAGSVIASMLAQYQNNHLISLNDLLDRNETWKQPLRRNCPAQDGDILVIDDTVSTGERMQKTRELLKDVPYDLKFGAYLAVNTSGLDYWYRTDPNNSHLFQLNVFHHWFCGNIMTDLDGVLSEDWTHYHETGDLAQAYADHLRGSRCLIRPTFPLKAIVTGRLETHREATLAWLAAHGIQFGELIMYPASRPEDRHDVGLWKGESYKQSDTMLFVESCPWQSQQIFSVARRDVLDWQNQRLV